MVDRTHGRNGALLRVGGDCHRGRGVAPRPGAGGNRSEGGNPKLGRRGSGGRRAVRGSALRHLQVEPARLISVHGKSGGFSPSGSPPASSGSFGSSRTSTC